MTDIVWDKYDNTTTIVRALAQSKSAEQAIQLYENAVEELGKLFATVYADNLKEE